MGGLHVVLKRKYGDISMRVESSFSKNRSNEPNAATRTFESQNNRTRNGVKR